MGYLSDLNINITALRITTGEKLNKLYADIGDKSLLLTSNKTSLVNAINEVKSKSLPSDDPRIANWDTAYNRGDFRTYGLGRASSISSLDLNTYTHTFIGGFGTIEDNRPFDYGTILNIKGTNQANSTQLVMPVQSAFGTRKMMYRGIRSGVIDPWVSLWDSIDFSTEDVASWRVAASIGDFRDFGLGVYNKSIPNENADILKESGFYTMKTTTIGNPSTYGSISLLHIGASESSGFQLAGRSGDSTDFWFRAISSGNSARPWRKLYHDGNISTIKTDLGLDTNYYKQSDVNLPTIDSKYVVFPKGGAGDASNYDWDTITGVGFYPKMFASGGRNFNAPNNGTGYWFTEVSEFNKNLLQIARPYRVQDGLWMRSRFSNNWSNWVEFYHTGNFSKNNYYTKNESLDLFVGLANTQTIGGTKTFSNSPIVPNATLAAHAINKGQMESWVSSQGFSTQTLTAGTNIQISASNVISATNTTYSAGTLALLNTGTDTANRVWKTRDLADYVTSKIAEGADSIWEHTPQGGLRIRNYDSLATRDGAIAITKGGGATKYNAIGIGTSVNSDGNDGLAIGPFGVNLGTYGTVVGPYSVNTAMEGVVIGPFLQNNQRGCTVTGRYNHPILNTTTNTITDSSPLFIIGNGKSASIRSNAYVMFSSGKGEFADVQSYKSQHSFGDMDIPNWKFIQDNLEIDGGNGSEDWVSNYGSGISVFEKDKANNDLRNSPYGGSGEIVTYQEFENVDKPTLVYLGSDGIWRKWNNSANAEQGNLSNSAVLGIALSDMESVLLKGYYRADIAAELFNLVSGIKNGQMFHTINKGSLIPHNATAYVERVFGYSVNSEIGYFNPWMFK